MRLILEMNSKANWKRAGVPSYSNLTKDDALDKTYREQRQALSLEYCRWFDRFDFAEVK